MTKQWKRFSLFAMVCALVLISAGITALDAHAGEPVPENPVTHPPAKPSAPKSEDKKAAPSAGEPTVAGGVVFAQPKDWVKETPRSAMRAAQFKIPDADTNKPSGTVAFFAKIGGSVDDNVNRWVGQVTEQAEPPKREEFMVGTLKVNTVSVTGTFTDGMAANPAPQKQTTLLGAVVSGGPEGPVFIKATGPKDLMAKQVEGWTAMLKGVKLK
ncbi:MAG TPA: hypothetical protein VG797_04665 [Phycisphaerales bacterium]|nr:hypothetical protein [Phycisphaerales bacterium]